MAASMRNMMLSRFMKHFPKISSLTASRSLVIKENYSTHVDACKDDPYKSASRIDIEQLFIEDKVQRLLRRLTGLNLDKVFSPRKMEHSVPEYRLLTDEQLRDTMQEAIERAHDKLQMPPVLRERKPCERIIRNDPELQGYGNSAFVFTDISYGYKDRERIIYVREPDGVLRTANWEEREKMINTYFAEEGREFYAPLMFFSPYLDEVLKKGWYEFVLDRACMQYEPDHPDYIRITHTTYDYISDASSDFEQLRSTRHFGPMVFYLCVAQKLDTLLMDCLRRLRLDDAASAVDLYYIIHNKVDALKGIEDKIDIIEKFLKEESQKRPQLELALQTFKDTLNTQQKTSAQSSA